MRVTVATAKTTVKDEQGREAEGLMLTCSRCGETVEVFGTSGASLRRGFVKLRDLWIIRWLGEVGLTFNPSFYRPPDAYFLPFPCPYIHDEKTPP